jgi:hypothetical protein
MKKIIFIALLLTSVLGMAANWVYLGTAQGRKYYYDSNNISGRTIGDEGHWTWVKIIYPNLWTIGGKDFNVKHEQWVFDCNGYVRIDDEFYYYNKTLVHQNTGTGKWASVVPDSMGEGLKDLVCR